MPALPAATTAYAVLAATDTLLAAGPARWRSWRRVTKPLLMPLLAAGTLPARRDPAVRRVLAAQALSGAGDVALLRPGSSRSFLTGLTCFLGAHAAYVPAFRSRSSTSLTDGAGSRAALVGGAVIAPTMALAARRRDPALAVPVGVYGVVLATMAAAAAAVDPDRGRARTGLGAALFLLSDTLLGVRTFLVEDRAGALDGAVMATYTAGQWLIRDGVVAGA